MRLKSQQRQSTNQRLTTTYVVQISVVVLVMVLICLLPQDTLGHVTRSKQSRVSRQLLDKALGTNEDCDSGDGAYHRPHFTRGRSVLVQLFEWKFVDIAEECRTFLGPKGYAGVQLSPVLEHTVIKTDSFQHPWWERYEMVSYRLASRSGDETDFWSMSRICNEHGVRIYVDVVLNHMAALLGVLLKQSSSATNGDGSTVNTLLSENVNISNSNYPDVPYTAKDFHRSCAIPSSPSADEIRNCQLNGHPDLDHSHLSVRQSIVDMLNKFIDMGVAGFRIDTAKHIWPIDLKLIYVQLKDLSKEFNFEDKSRPFIYHDVFDMGLDSISKTEYSTYGVVSEYLFPAEISAILHGKAPLSSLINWGPAMGFLPHQDSLVFIDSHDTQRGLPSDLGYNRMLTYKQRHKYIMANALMLAHPYGRIKRIMSSYYFDVANINQGAPLEESDEDAIRSPEFNDQQQCVPSSGWVCEHRWPALVQLVKMANYFSVPGQQEESVIHFQTNGPNHIAFCRGHKAFVAMNNDLERDFEMKVYTCLEEGIYCDVVSGGLKEGGQECHGRSLEVDADGFASMNLAVADGNMDESEGLNFSPLDEEGDDGDIVENFGVLVVYVGSKVGLEDGADVQEGGEEVLDEKEENGNVEEPNEDQAVDGGTNEDVEEVHVQEVPDEEKEEGEDPDAGDAAVDPAEGTSDNEVPEEDKDEGEDAETGDEEALEEGAVEGADEPAEDTPVDEVPEENNDSGEGSETGEGVVAEAGPEEPPEVTPDEEAAEEDNEEGKDPVEGKSDDEVPEEGNEEDDEPGAGDEPAEEKSNDEAPKEDAGDEEVAEEDGNDDAQEEGEDPGDEPVTGDEPAEGNSGDENPEEDHDAADGEVKEEDGKSDDEAPEEGNDEPAEVKSDEEVPEEDHDAADGEGKEDDGKSDDEAPDEGKVEGNDEPAEVKSDEEVPEEGTDAGDGEVAGEDGNEPAEVNSDEEVPEDVKEEGEEAEAGDEEAADEPAEGKSNEEVAADQQEPETGDEVAEDEDAGGPAEGKSDEKGAEEEKEEAEEPKDGEEVSEESGGGEETLDENKEEDEAQDTGEKEIVEDNAELDETTQETAENPTEKIDKRETEGNEDADAEEQVEAPIVTNENESPEEGPQPVAEEQDIEINTQDSQINSTIEMIKNTAKNELETLANDTKAASVKTEEIAAAGVFQLTKSRQGNG